MNDDELAAIGALAEAATPGPWVQTEEIDGVYAGRRTVVRVPGGKRVLSVGQTREHYRNEANAAFCVAARTAVPALVAALAEARAENDELRSANERLQQVHGAYSTEAYLIFKEQLEQTEAALAEAHRTLADVGEPSWEYGHQLADGLGWLPEPRGEYYATCRRKVWRGRAEFTDGSPLLPAARSGAAEPTKEPVVNLAQRLRESIDRAAACRSGAESAGEQR